MTIVERILPQPLNIISKAVLLLLLNGSIDPRLVEAIRRVRSPIDILVMVHRKGAQEQVHPLASRTSTLPILTIRSINGLPLLLTTTARQSLPLQCRTQGTSIDLALLQALLILG